MSDERVLVVKDEKAVARGLAYALEKEWYTVLWAEKGEAALAPTESRLLRELFTNPRRDFGCAALIQAMLGNKFEP